MSKSIIITGSCSGLGLEFTKQYLDKGYKVIGIDRDKKELDLLEDAYEHRFFSVHQDLLKIKDHSKFLNLIFETYPNIDLFINNAGIARVGPFNDCTDSEISKIMKLNCEIPMIFTKHLIDIFEKKGSGSILNIASVAGHVPCPFASAYTASKFGLVGYTKTLQIELEYKKSKVNLHLCSPGFVKTNLFQNESLGQFTTGFTKLADVADKCVTKIIKRVEKGELFISPTINGNLILKFDWFSPKISKFLSRIVSSKSYKQVLGIDKIDSLD